MVQLGPATLDLDGIRAGDSNKMQITITRAGRPIDLTGTTLTAMARSAANATDALDAVITAVDEVHGVMMLAWPGDDVTTWLGSEVEKSGVWDLQMDDGADIETLVSGSFKAVLDVTHG